jgi:hypothetical protein
MIIGLLGRSRVGKDTAASYIINVLGDHATELVRLSKPLKDAVQSLYGFTHDQVEGDAKELIDPRYGVTPRVCIQQLCEHIMTNHGRDFFSKHVYSKWDATSYDLRRHIVIPDVRYQHDIDEIRKRGGLVIKIMRTSSSIPLHPWEESIDQLFGHHTITNDADIASFHKSINQILCENELV